MFTFSDFNLWLHILSAVTWVGAILYTWLVLIPGLNGFLPGEEAVFRTLQVEKGFRKIAHLVIAFITITGIVNLMNPLSIEKFKTSPSFGMLVTLKVVLLGVMILLHLLRQGFYGRRIAALSQDQKVSAEAMAYWRKSKSLLVWQAAVGISLIFIGVNLR
ncbi:MAG: hypothetical protein A2Z27_03975 [candidate division Zixibacteria bacterium RBG_16_50_21]|nr:MAG: hypothetical protein A2Z27_03975 [candidate division Zixibacteria bacterium RBG_16_50_21]